MKVLSDSSLSSLNDIELKAVNGGCWDGFCPISTMDAFVEGFVIGWNTAKSVWDKTYESLK